MKISIVCSESSIPKAESFCAPSTLKRNLALINVRPRKVLNFHSARELWDSELNFCCA